METPNTYTAFDGHSLVVHGPLSDVVLAIKKRLGKAMHSSILIFSDATGKTMDFNFQGSEKDVLKRLDVFVASTDEAPHTGPGRPKLGVVAREVSLLPRHWEWLASQAGGASATIRRLVDEAKKASAAGNLVKQAQERTYSFMSVMAGDLEGYEEALRSLYKRDKTSLTEHIKTWPQDIRNHVTELAKPIF